jgi:hypothetical protein
LQREDGFTAAHFGLLDTKNTLIDYFHCVPPDHTPFEAPKIEGTRCLACSFQ